MWSDLYNGNRTVTATVSPAFTLQSEISLFVLYLETVCNLSSSEYYNAISQYIGGAGSGTLCQNIIVLIVDSGVFLPLIGYPSFFNPAMITTLTGAALPCPKVQGAISTGLNLASTLLLNQAWIGSIIKDTSCIATTVVKAGNDYQGYTSAWGSLGTSPEVVMRKSLLFLQLLDIMQDILMRGSDCWILQAQYSSPSKFLWTWFIQAIFCFVPERNSVPMPAVSETSQVVF